MSKSEGAVDEDVLFTEVEDIWEVELFCDAASIPDNPVLVNTETIERSVTRIIENFSEQAFVSHIPRRRLMYKSLMKIDYVVISAN